MSLPTGARSQMSIKIKLLIMMPRHEIRLLVIFLFQCTRPPIVLVVPEVIPVILHFFEWNWWLIIELEAERSNIFRWLILRLLMLLGLSGRLLLTVFLVAFFSKITIGIGSLVSCINCDLRIKAVRLCATHRCANLRLGHGQHG